MIKYFVTYPIQFILLVLVQVLVLNNIQYSGYINPFLYIIFILWLPIEMPKWALLLVATLLGLSVDIFSDTIGMHTSACIFMAFCRPFVLNLLAPRDGYEVNSVPNMIDFGIQWFVGYAAILIFLHHIFLFFVEVFRFSDFFATMGRTLSSSFFSLILITITQFLKYNSESKR